MSPGSVLILIASTLCAALGQILFRAGARNAETLVEFFNRWIMVGLFAYGVGTVLWIYVLSRAPLTVAYPFTALTFVLVYLAGAVLFGEPVTVRAMAGVVLVLGGLFLITAP
jgi:undecaprenyl phosphate-alpha-L-ara4N flippase subunit ArnE